MKGITVFLIIVLLIGIIVAVILPKKEKTPVSLQREAPLPQEAEERIPASLQTTPSAPAEEPQPQEKTEMKVNFYAIDREKAEKGESLGTAKLENGKLSIDVTDPKLKEILEKPYSTMAGEVKGGVAVDWLVTHQPGTIEHLRAIAIECWQFGYIGEIVE
jgi:hypothetical protein